MTDEAAQRSNEIDDVATANEQQTVTVSILTSDLKQRSEEH